MPGDPAAYLAAALDRAEETAKASAAEASYADRGDSANWAADGDGRVRVPMGEISWVTGQRFDHIDDHIAGNDPAHVLCMVAAHRKLAALHKPMAEEDAFPLVYPVRTLCNVCVDWDKRDRDGPDPESWPCDVIRVLAGAYGWTEA